MISTGAKVRFCPHFDRKEYDTPAEQRAKAVTGRISYVNWNHRVFTVEYESGGTTQVEAFKFFDIGNVVTIC